MTTTEILIFMLEISLWTYAEFCQWCTTDFQVFELLKIKYFIIVYKIYIVNALIEDDNSKIISSWKRLTWTSIWNLVKNCPRTRCPSKIGEFSIVKPVTTSSSSLLLRSLHESISFWFVILQHINSASLLFWLSEAWKSTIFLSIWHGHKVPSMISGKNRWPLRLHFHGIHFKLL